MVAELELDICGEFSNGVDRDVTIGSVDRLIDSGVGVRYTSGVEL